MSQSDWRAIINRALRQLEDAAARLKGGPDVVVNTAVVLARLNAGVADVRSLGSTL